LTVETVERRLLDAYGATDPQPLDYATLELAKSLADDHRVA